MIEEPDQFQILIDTFNEDNLINIINKSHKEITLQFFKAMKYFNDHNKPMPQHWLKTATSLLIKTAEARTDNTRNPLANSLALKHNPHSWTRDKAYNRVIHHYLAQGQSQNKAIQSAIALITKYSQSNTCISTTAMKNLLKDSPEHEKCTIKFLVKIHLKDPDYPSAWLKNIPPDKLRNH